MTYGLYKKQRLLLYRASTIGCLLSIGNVHAALHVTGGAELQQVKA